MSLERLHYSGIFNFTEGVWNDLPLDIWESSSISSFKTTLKTHYFNLAFIDVPDID